MFLQLVSLIISTIFLLGCSTTQKKIKPVIQDQKLARMHSGNIKKIELNRIDHRIKQFQKQDLFRKSRYPLPKSVTDDTLYAEVLKSYQAKDIQAVGFYTTTLLKKYPTSIHADNALYLKGKMLYRQGRHAKSLRYFQKIISAYAHSNKRSSALLMKARAFSQLNLKKLAIQALQQLQKEYPGSPEAYQADSELELLSKT